MRKILLSLFVSVFTACLVISSAAHAQTRITGKIIDANTKEELIGATISVKGTTTATTTSLDGSFKLTVPTGTTTVSITYVGYIPQDIALEGKTSIGTIELQ